MLQLIILDRVRSKELLDRGRERPFTFEAIALAGVRWWVACARAQDVNRVLFAATPPKDLPRSGKCR